MPRKSLRCSIELDIHSVSCPGVYLPHRNHLYLSVSMFSGQYRRTQLSSPIFPLLFNENFRFDKIFYTAYQPQQVAEALEYDHIRIELVQLSDLQSYGHLLAYYETNARDFLYPYPQSTVTYGCTDRHVLMQRTLDFPGIAPKLEFSTRTILTEVDRPTGDECLDLGLLSDSCVNYHPLPARSALRRRRSLSRHRSPSPGARLRHSMRGLAIGTDGEEKPAFVVRKVSSDLIGRKPGSREPCLHNIRRIKSLSQSRYRIGSGYQDDDYQLVSKRCSTTHKVVREPEWSSDDYVSDSLSDTSDPETYMSRSRSHSVSTYQPRRSTSPILGRRSLKDRFEDRVLCDMIEKKVDDAIRRNRSRERSASRGRICEDDDFSKIRDLERDLAISRNRSFVHINDGEYWCQKAADYTGKSHRQLFNDTLDNVYRDMHTKTTRFDDRAY